MDVKSRKDHSEHLESVEVKCRSAEEVLRSIVVATSAKTGTEFIRSLVKTFALTLKVSYALVGEVIDGTQRVKTLAVWANGGFAENFEYDLEGTPCNNVVAQTMRYYPRDIKKLFPEDYIIADMEVESYLGVPIFDSRHNPLGVMAALGEKPIEDEQIAKSLLSIFSARVGAEMERNRAEEALKESENKYRRIIETTTEGVWVIDDKGATTFVNDRMASMLGESADKIIGTSIFEYMDEEWRKIASSNIENKRKKGIAEQYDVRLRRKDGSYFWALIALAPIFDTTGRYAGVLGMLSDITKRKEVEEALKTNEERLEDLVEERTAELTKVNEQLRLEINERKKAEKKVARLNKDLSHHVVRLEEANRELEAFSYSLAHDLNAPLRIINGFSKLLLKYYGDKIEGEGKHFIETISNSSLKMGQFITDILALARLGRQEIRFTEVDMNRLAETIFAELKHCAPERDIELILNPLPPAYGEKTMLTQVFSNLLSNAVKFTRPKDKAVIEVGGRTEGRENIYCVKDNGVGFDMKYYDKLFGVFKRLHLEDEFEGTGAGLAIIQRIIKRHDGRVWAEGTVNQGAAFYFALPLRAAGKKPKGVKNLK